MTSGWMSPALSRHVLFALVHESAVPWFVLTNGYSPPGITVRPPGSIIGIRCVIAGAPAPGFVMYLWILSTLTAQLCMRRPTPSRLEIVALVCPGHST